MPANQTPSNIGFSRPAINVPQQAPLLLSGANFFKIVPGLSTAWFEILAAVPEARLALFPFNPNWSPVYQHRLLTARLQDEAAAAGVAFDRIILLKPLQHAADTLHYSRAADLYLDSYPFSGAVSVYDPLAEGLPVVAWEGQQARSRQCASMLRDLGLDELIANCREAYVSLAIALARDGDRRRALAARVRQRMKQDPLGAGRDLETRLAALLRRKCADWI